MALGASGDECADKVVQRFGTQREVEALRVHHLQVLEVVVDRIDELSG